MNSDNYSADSSSRSEEPLHPIDQIAIRKLGGFNFLTVDQWNELPTHLQLRRIQREEVVFISRGQEVPLSDALAYLKAVRDAKEEQQKYPPPTTRRDRNF